MYNNMPYWRLSAVYFFYFAVVGVVSPYLALYLEHLGYSAKAIGLICAIPMVTRVLAPNVWGWLAKKTGALLAVIIAGSLGAWLCFIGVLFRQDLWSVIVSLFLFSFFWNAIIAQFEVLTLVFLGDKPQSYGQVRLWGSVGFIVTVIAVGVALDYTSVMVIPWSIFFFLGGIFLCCVSLPRKSVRDDKVQSIDFYRILMQPKVILFLVVIFLIQISLGMYHAFYSLYLEQFGYSRSLIGVLWSIGAAAEIVLFMYLSKLFTRYSMYYLLGAVLVVSLIRWLLIGVSAHSVILLCLAQLGHAFTFGLCHGIAIEFIRQEFGEAGQSQGQAFYSAFGFGLAMAVGSVLGGFVFAWQANWFFGFAALIVICAMVIHFFVLGYVLRKPFNA